MICPLLRILYIKIRGCATRVGVPKWRYECGCCHISHKMQRSAVSVRFTMKWTQRPRNSFPDKNVIFAVGRNGKTEFLCVTPIKDGLNLNVTSTRINFTYLLHEWNSYLVQDPIRSWRGAQRIYLSPRSCWRTNAIIFAKKQRDFRPGQCHGW